MADSARAERAIDFSQQSFRRRAIRGIAAAMSEENFSAALDEKIAAALKNILAAVARLLQAAAQQLKVAEQGRRRKNLPPGKTLQREGAISLAPRIGKERERPSVHCPIRSQRARLGERNRDDRKAAPVEFGLGSRHLAEVRLARQSGQVAEKDQQRAICDLIGEAHG